jgi:hypothetical protein
MAYVRRIKASTGLSDKGHGRQAELAGRRSIFGYRVIRVGAWNVHARLDGQATVVNRVRDPLHRDYLEGSMIFENVLPRTNRSGLA